MKANVRTALNDLAEEKRKAEAAWLKARTAGASQGMCHALELERLALHEVGS